MALRPCPTLTSQRPERASRYSCPYASTTVQPCPDTRRRRSAQVVSACHGEACSHRWSAAACNTAWRSCSRSSPRVAKIGRECSLDMVLFCIMPRPSSGCIWSPTAAAHTLSRAAHVTVADCLHHTASLSSLAILTEAEIVLTEVHSFFTVV